MVSFPVCAELSFVDRRVEAGIEYRHVASPTESKYLIETMGGGVALLDFDADGLLDVFFVNGGRIVEGDGPVRVVRDSPELQNRLYRNNGDGTFVDVTEDSGLETAPNGAYGMGAAVGDIDNDGLPDLLITGVGSAELYRNEGGGRFTPAGLATDGWFASAGFADADGDGALEAFATRYLDWSFEKHVACIEPVVSYCPPTEHGPVSNRLFKASADGSWEDVSGLVGLEGLLGKSLGVAFNDVDGDRDIDIVVANDSEPQQLLLNDGAGRFVDDALLAGLALNEDGGRYAGMGVDFQDYDNDSDPDVLITNLARELYALYVNDDGIFDYKTRQSNLAQITARMSGWGMLFADLNLDGWKDLFVAQGHVLDSIEQTDAALSYLQPPLVAVNRGGRFEDRSADSGMIFTQPLAGRGAAFGDLDNDGDVDIVMTVLGDHPAVLYNTAADRGELPWIAIELVGRASPRDGQGAGVSVRGASGLEQHRMVTTAGSYLSANDPRAHFGLGSDDVLEWVRIRWPSGLEQELRGVAARQVFRIEEPR